MERLTGWLFDVYAERGGMAVWFLADDGRRVRAFHPWRPVAKVRGARGDAERLRAWLEGRGAPTALAAGEGLDLMTGRTLPVFELAVGDAERFVALLAEARRLFPGLEYFNADLAPDRTWFYTTRHFPLARVEAELEDGVVRALACTDSIWDTDYDLPPFAMLGLRPEGESALNPAHGGRRGGLEVHLPGGEVRVLDTGDPVLLLERLNGLIARADPDILVTEYGDAWLLPRLDELARRCRIPLALNRDARRAPRVAAARSYFTYGRIVHRDQTWLLHGRFHLDRRNSFTLEETGFDGLFETARLSRLPVQTCSRTSTGTGISSMQLAAAFAENILVPVDKAVTESFKGGDELLTVDKGGLVFQPELGLYEGVGELDFASMYPAIMVAHNLSPETIGCACCGTDGELVPETGRRSCVRREGLIARVLAPLLKKRAAYKVQKKHGATPALRERAAARVAAHKWMLVCCFGYLGYKNARFGRIEAHEATTAWGREAILRAKEVAEGLGFHLIHAIVDSLWVHRPGRATPPEDYEALTRAIEAATGLPISYEGTYRWIAFLPSTADPRRPVSQRYVGAFGDGEVKVRNLALRRSDTPAFLAGLQLELLQALSAARDAAEARRIAAGLVPRVAETVARLREGRMRPGDLAIFRHLSRDPATYARPTPVAVASGQLAARGAALAAGERVGYVLGEERPWALQVLPDGAPYDAEAYAELTRRAADELLSVFGVREFTALEKEGSRPARSREDPRQLLLLPTP